MAKNSITTNAMRLLHAAGIEFSSKEYPVDENDLSGTHAAELMGIDAEQVFKTLVTVNVSGAYRVFVIPVAYELDLKKCAAASGDKRLEMLPMKELLPVTGYIRGGCSPVGMKKKLPTYIDETATLCDEIYVSAGQRGLQIGISPEALAEYTDAVFADLIV